MDHIAIVGDVGGSHIVDLLGKESHAGVIETGLEIVFWYLDDGVLEFHVHGAGIGYVFTTGGRGWVVVHVSNHEICILRKIADVDVLGFAFGEHAQFEAFGAGSATFFDLVEFFGEEEFIGIDEEVAGFFVFGNDFFEGQGCIGDVGVFTFCQGGVGVKVEVCIDLCEFQVAIRFADGEDARPAKLSTMMTAGYNAIFCVGEVNEFGIELCGIDLYVEFAIGGVEEKREQAIDAFGIFGFGFDGGCFVFGFFSGGCCCGFGGSCGCGAFLFFWWLIAIGIGAEEGECQDG